MAYAAFLFLSAVQAKQGEKVEAHGIRAVYGSTTHPVRFADELSIRLDQFPASALIHLDLDCLDTSVGQANDYAAPGGLSVADLEACMAEVVTHTAPVAMTIASFDPDLPGSDAIANAGVKAAQFIARAIQP